MLESIFSLISLPLEPGAVSSLPGANCLNFVHQLKINQQHNLNQLRPRKQLFIISVALNNYNLEHIENIGSIFPKYIHGSFSFTKASCKLF